VSSRSEGASWAVDAAWGALAGVVSLAAALLNVGGPQSLRWLWGHNDNTTVYALARTLGSQLWFTPNHDLGFPYLQDAALVPTADYANILGLKVLVVVTHDPLVAANSFLLLSFFTVAVSAYALFRTISIPVGISFALAVSASLVPWHFARFVHMFLANYSSVFLGLILVVAVLSWNLTLSDPGRGRRRDLAIALGLVVIVGLSGIYYALFISVLAVLTLAGQVLIGRRGRGLIPAFWLAALPIVVALASTWLGSLAAVTTPPATNIFARSPEESQAFGGALFTLLRTTGLWSHGFPFPSLDAVSIVGSGDTVEADAMNSTLGVLAVLVCFAVCALILLGNGKRRPAAYLESLGYWPWLFLLSTLFFVRSGFGSVLGVLLHNQFRSWGRFAIVIVAVALVILGLTVTYWRRRSTRPRLVGAVVVYVILALTALDMASMPHAFDQVTAAKEAAELRVYGADIDAAVPPGCGIYQLPAYPYPEVIPTDGTESYDPLLPYVFSQHARWSYGGIKGTEAGDWAVDGVSSDPATLLTQLRAKDFCAVQVDTLAYQGRVSPVGPLTSALGPPVAASSSGRWVLFALRP
jgi:hypothetical protein